MPKKQKLKKMMIHKLLFKHLKMITLNDRDDETLSIALKGGVLNKKLKDKGLHINLFKNQDHLKLGQLLWRKNTNQNTLVSLKLNKIYLLGHQKKEGTRKRWKMNLNRKRILLNNQRNSCNFLKIDNLQVPKFYSK